MATKAETDEIKILMRKSLALLRDHHDMLIAWREDVLEEGDSPNEEAINRAKKDERFLLQHMGELSKHV